MPTWERRSVRAAQRLWKFLCLVPDLLTQRTTEDFPRLVPWVHFTNIPQTEFTISPLSPKYSSSALSAQWKAPLSHSDASILDTSSLLPSSPISPVAWQINLWNISHTYSSLSIPSAAPRVQATIIWPRWTPQPWNRLFSPCPAPPECVGHPGTNQLSKMQSPSPITLTMKLNSWCGSQVTGWSCPRLTQQALRHLLPLLSPRPLASPSRAREPLSLPLTCHVLSCWWV